MDDTTALAEYEARTKQMQADAVKYAKRSRNGVSLNITYDLEDGRAIKVKKVNEQTNRFFAVQLCGVPFLVGETIYTTKSDHGIRMGMQVEKRHGRKWVMHILGQF